MYILSAKEIAKADQATIASTPISSIDLMEHAATQCFDWLHTRLQGQPIPIHVFCGIGNNGGDGLVMARHLLQHGYHVNCYVVNFSDKRSDDFLTNYARLKETGLWRTNIIRKTADFPEIQFEDIVIDAIFGNGLTRSPEGFTKELIKYINSTKVYTLSIDMPSGLFADKPVTDPDAVIKAGHILTFQYPKLALFLRDNKDYVKTWEVIDIGLDAEFVDSLQPKKHVVFSSDISALYKPRNKWDHKGNFGHSLIIGGSFGKIGAVTLATKAAVRIGSGLATAYIPKCGYSIVQSTVPEAMVEVDEDHRLTYFNFKTQPTVIGIGPGMGTSDSTRNGFYKFLKENELPLVIDADGLNLLSQNTSICANLPESSILTPHPKELQRLIGEWLNDFEKLEKTQNFCQDYNCIVVIKDAYTVVVTADEFYFNTTGNSGLATGGSGDVLTGLITGLIAQGYSPLESAKISVYLHGLAADIGVQDLGMEGFTATAIIDYLPDAWSAVLNPPQDTPNDATEEEDTSTNN